MNAELTAQEPSAKYLVQMQPPLFRHFDLIAQAPGGVTRLRELIFQIASTGHLFETYEEVVPSRLDTVSEFVMGQAPPGAECNEVGQGTIFVKTGEFGRLFPEVREWTTKPLKFARQGDVLICVVGATIGKLNLAIDCAIGRSVAAIRPQERLDTKYLYYMLMPFTLALRRESRGSAQGVIGKSELSKVTIRVPSKQEQLRIVTRVEELMQLCDVLEASGQLEAQQHAQLVGTLLGMLTQSETPEALADNWQLIATHFDVLLDRPEAVDTLEQTILQLAVRGLLVPQDPTDEPASVLLQKIRTEKDHLIAQGKIKRDKPLPPITDEEKPFELPQGWEWVRFGQIANIASNLVPPSLHAEKWQVAPDCIEKATGRLLHKRTVAQAEVVSPNHLFKAGQLLYSKIRPSLSKAVLVDFEGLCSADMYPIESQLDMEFLLLYILSEPFLKQVSIAENRVKMPKLNQEALVAFMVALPPLVEQTKIVNRVNELRCLCVDLRKKVNTVRMVMESLSSALIFQS